MPDLVATAVLTAIDAGYEVRLDRLPGPLGDTGTVRITVVDRLPNGRDVYHRNAAYRKELTSPDVGDYVLSHAILSGVDAVTKAPRP